MNAFGALSGGASSGPTVTSCAPDGASASTMMSTASPPGTSTALMTSMPRPNDTSEPGPGLSPPIAIMTVSFCPRSAVRGVIDVIGPTILVGSTGSGGSAGGSGSTGSVSSSGSHAAVASIIITSAARVRNIKASPSSRPRVAHRSRRRRRARTRWPRTCRSSRARRSCCCSRRRSPRRGSRRAFRSGS